MNYNQISFIGGEKTTVWAEGNVVLRYSVAEYHTVFFKQKRSMNSYAHTPYA